MCEALSKQQFFVEYQPIVELSSNRIYKAEGLVRWAHPFRGLLLPSEFISLAEDNGLILEIGDQVFKEAANQAKKLRDSGYSDFQITVNKSPIQFLRDDFLYKDQMEFMQKIGLSGDAIVLEITESLLLQTQPIVAEKLAYFNSNGIELALDDFGTGYSSLSYLKKFEIEYIKIDRAFVCDLEINEANKSIVEAVIVMAHKLGIKVIAEGVETVEQKDILAGMGCDFGQGYFFARPLSSEKFEEYLRFAGELFGFCQTRGAPKV
jgi:EAL domain-containing protein (putative c-di-GMP-specific phosphodiesterase class I)